MTRGENRHNLFLLCALEGMNTTQIAETFGVEATTVRSALERPENRVKLEDGRNRQREAIAQRGAREIIAGAAADAAEVLVGLMMHGESERIRFSSANAILEKAGYVPPTASTSLVQSEPPRLVIQDLTVNVNRSPSSDNGHSSNNGHEVGSSIPNDETTPIIDIGEVIDFSETREKAQE